jgi:hypothetical protein
METDDLTILDVEYAVAHGKIRKKEADDPRGVRWEVVGPTEDGREVGVVVRMMQADSVLVVTVYERQ